MSARAQLTFVPSDLVPAGGSLALWWQGGAGDDQSLAEAAVRLGLPAGDEATLATIDVVDGEVVPVDVPARLVPVLPAVRGLVVMAPGSDWPAWSRPSASVLSWSVASKLALELVAAGRVLPTFATTDVPGEGRASWRAVVAGDSRPEQIAQALPVTAHAARRASGGVWEPDELVRAFLDAVADACARGGRRPELDPRRRGPRSPWPEMWARALTSSDPTVTHLRVSPEDVEADVEDWAAPLAGRGRRSAVRLLLRLGAPVPDGHDGDRTASWPVSFHLQSTLRPEERVAATDVWDRAGQGLELAGRTVEDPEAVLVRGLAAAARLFPPLDRALSRRRPDGTELSGAEVAELLGDGADALAAGGIEVELPSELRDTAARRIRLRVRIGQSTPAGPRVEGEDLLDLAAITDLRYEIALGDETISEEDLAGILAAGQPLVRWRGSWVRVDHDELDRLGELAGSSGSLQLTEALAAALSGQHQVPDIGWVDAVADGDLGAVLERLRQRGGPEQAHIVDIEGELRPYQKRGVAWLQQLTSMGSGAVLADEMGLGKTIQAMALLTSRAQDRPHLVVCPTSVVGNWERELARFAPRLPVIRHHGPDRPVTARSFEPGSVAVTSYALLRRDLGLLEDVDWDVVVFDEAQQIKNPASKGARAARSLTARARVAMTGTPLENRLSELWSIVDVTNPGLMGSQRRFNERFAVPIERWHDEAAAERLRRLVAPFVLRRRKDDDEVSVDLPPKQEITVACSLTREQAGLYQAAVDAAFSDGGLGPSSFERRGRILALLTALKQICNHPAQYLRDKGRLVGRSGKLARATEILAELVDAGERALVFTQFREMGMLLASHLADSLELPEVPFLHGGVSLPGRDELVHRFQEEEDAPPIMLVSLRAGGTGLNLTRASHVLHYDRWWNPAVEDQATDRVHRIGQTKAVTVHTLVAAGTVEDRIADLLDRKRALADAVVGSGETWITELDDDELHDLVALSVSDLEDDDEEESPPLAPRPRLVSIPGGRA